MTRSGYHEHWDAMLVTGPARAPVLSPLGEFAARMTVASLSVAAAFDRMAADFAAAAAAFARRSGC